MYRMAALHTILHGPAWPTSGVGGTVPHRESLSHFFLGQEPTNGHTARPHCHKSPRGVSRAPVRLGRVGHRRALKGTTFSFPSFFCFYYFLKPTRPTGPMIARLDGAPVSKQTNQPSKARSWNLDGTLIGACYDCVLPSSTQMTPRARPSLATTR